ncbi:hypothetical protein ELUMI_v1c08480 [Williamsoniiplasma luminosum]|uniref:Uncharacterized protein n=1 Tax=Williamsoniiplasma luminosum TaxID=214888 RepID=A0A2K8NUT4_9MOLU|nr:hypothetical protein [Williamsoniiplasma luminosum]ATZ17569.1 hypothetical protein ELUMI_v1c08480 [Williamsoniiplasma luminosum]
MAQKKINEFDLFLINNFANNESEWNKFTPLFASNFLEDFFKNLNYMQAQLDVFKNRKKKEISLTEKRKLTRILAIADLSDCIHVYNEDKQYWIDIVSIDKKFKKASKETSVLISKTVAEMEKESLKNFDTSFEKLEKSFKTLITFVKEIDFRKEVYIKLLLEKEKETKIISSYEYTNNFY